MKNIFKNRRGFTLLELLVVVLIIGILASIALPQYQNSVIKADFAEAYIKLKAAAQIEEMCRLQNGVEYCNPSNEGQDIREQISIEIMGCSSWPCTLQEKKNMKFEIQNGDRYNLAYAQYLKEDVCVCITKDYKFILSQYDETECAGYGVTKDYAKILGIPDVTDDDDHSCSCC